MKNILSALLIVGLLFNSCDSQLDINKDPDNLTPEDLSLKHQLPSGITGVAAVQGTPWAIIGGIWSQFWSQSNDSNQYRSVDNYTIGATDQLAATGWINAYDALLDIRNIKRKAATDKNWNYYLIATVLETYTSQMLTDWYGDIPYTEANNPTFFHPKFNSTQEIYTLLINDLDDALSKDLSTSTGVPPQNDDLIFGGNMKNWVKFANTLKLKIYLRQTKVNPDIAKVGIKKMFDSGDPFLDIDASLTGFTDAPSKSNPLYESDKRQANTSQNLRASTTMFSFLDANSDPRLNLFYSGDGSLIPLNQGDYDNPASPSSFAVSLLYPETPVYFISYEESLLMQAEALERYYGGSGSKALYDAAVLENFKKWQIVNLRENKNPINIDATSFVNSGGAYEYPLSGSFNEKLTSIITQKWIASYPGNGAEAFFEWHRTGIPAISLVPQNDQNYIPGTFVVSVNSVLGQNEFPQRLVYPTEETQRNLNAPAALPITTPIWWNY